MSTDKQIRDALLPFGDPVENGLYTGKAEQYYTFNYTTLGANFADDVPEEERVLIQVHFFAPLNKNITERIAATKKALHSAGFTWPEVTSADDDEGRHRVFECEGVQEVGLDG